MNGDIYKGNSFNVAKSGDRWAIWHFLEDEDQEQINLTTEAMDELEAYFRDCYGEDRRRKV